MRNDPLLARAEAAIRESYQLRQEILRRRVEAEELIIRLQRHIPGYAALSSRLSGSGVERRRAAGLIRRDAPPACVEPFRPNAVALAESSCQGPAQAQPGQEKRPVGRYIA
jgi:hypothetical protein